MSAVVLHCVHILIAARVFFGRKNKKQNCLMSSSSVCKLDSNQNHSLKHKLMKRLSKTKRPLCFSSPRCKSLDLRIHVAEQCKEAHIREASIFILLWTQRLWSSSQLGPTRIVLHLHNLRESSLLFFFRPRFFQIFLKPLCIFPRWVGGLFVQRTLSCVYQRWRPLLCKCLF